MPDSLASLLVRQADTRGRHPALIDAAPLDYASLFARVTAAAVWAAGLPPVVGLIGPKCADWVVADLALTIAGRTIVPLPEFFAVEQLAHIVADAGVDAVVSVGGSVPDVLPAGLPVIPFGAAEPPAATNRPVPPREARRIIYTSGTTGRPKGAILDDSQVFAAAAALVAAAEATADDVHLSILPYSLLLEQIAGIRAPLLAGATSVVCRDGFAAALNGDPAPLATAADRAAPTVSVLVPDLLRGWTAALRATGTRAPASLRFVAVGGATVPPSLAEAAWQLGLPVHEGYGLSECCSVVAVNRPGRRRPGTVGPPISGLLVAIDDGEIVVHGPAVMRGYVGREAVAGPWRTGDLGRIGPDGALEVFGRKDEVIVTAFGRNVSPEWIEAQVIAHPAVERAVAFDGGGAFPALVVCFADQSDLPATERLAAVLAPLPDYARPRRIHRVPSATLRDLGLIGPGGKPRRKLFARHFTATTATDTPDTASPTRPERDPCLSTSA